MEIAVIGISYKKADIDIRGKVAFTASQKIEITKELINLGIPEVLILSTCNRSEIYIATRNMNNDIKLVKNLYIKMAGSKILSYIYIKKFENSIEHIFQVATGLDSLVIGEDEILSQLKSAMNFAHEQKSCKKYLDKVVRESITFSKKVKSAYRLSENKLSVASIGVEFLKKKFGNLMDKNILLIGTGDMGQLILKYLEFEEIENLYLTNRTMNKEKMNFLIDKNIKLIEYNERYEYLSKMDIVISATSSPHVIIKLEECPTFNKEITFLDMAVPRDIDSKLEKENFVDIITLDTLNQIADEHLNMRKDIGIQIGRLIIEEAKEIELWILRTKTDSIIKGFHKRQKSILIEKEEQLKKLNLDENILQEILEIINSSTWQMIKKPVEQLKTIKEKEDLELYKTILEELFLFESEDLT